MDGSLCLRSNRMPSDIDRLCLSRRNDSPSVAVFVCLHDDDAVRDLLCRPLDIPSLSAHAPEAERLVQESIDDAAGALGAATVRIPGPLRHAIIVRVGSFAELEKTSLRLVALASARNVTHAAARLGMAPVSLTRWLGRRRWLLPILNSLRKCFEHPDV